MAGPKKPQKVGGASDGGNKFMLSLFLTNGFLLCVIWLLYAKVCP